MHARSHMMFESNMMFDKVFSKNMSIGICLERSDERSKTTWGRASECVREGLGEIIAYIHAEGRNTWS